MSFRLILPLVALLATAGCVEVDDVRDYNTGYNQYPNQYYTYGIEDRYGDRHYHHHKHRHTVDIDMDANALKTIQDTWGVKHHYHSHNQNFENQMPDWQQHNRHHHKTHGDDYQVRWKIKHNHADNW